MESLNLNRAMDGKNFTKEPKTTENKVLNTGLIEKTRAVGLRNLHRLNLGLKKHRTLGKVGEFKVKNRQLHHPIELALDASSLEDYRDIIRYRAYALPRVLNNQVNGQPIVDCDPNTGVSTIFFANSFPDSKVLAVAPNSDREHMLRRNIEPYEDQIRAISNQTMNPVYLLDQLDGAHEIGLLKLRSGKVAQQLIDSKSIHELLDRTFIVLFDQHEEPSLNMAEKVSSVTVSHQMTPTPLNQRVIMYNREAI